MNGEGKNLLTRWTTALACAALLFGVSCGRERPAKKATDVQAAPPAASGPQAIDSASLPGILLSIPTLRALPNSRYVPFLSISAAAWGSVAADRCQSYGDSLNAAQGPERLAWAKRCTPEFQEWLDVATNMRSPAPANKPLYPTYGRILDNNEPVNILNYKAPITESAACDLPVGYVLVGVCSPHI